MKMKKYIRQTIVTTLLDVEEHTFKSKDCVVWDKTI